MAKRKAIVTKTEIKRLIAAARDMGLDVESVGIDPAGNVRTFPDAPNHAPMTPEQKLSEWVQQNAPRAS